jgi:hypothetical protein
MVHEGVQESGEQGGQFAGGPLYPTEMMLRLWIKAVAVLARRHVERSARARSMSWYVSSLVGLVVIWGSFPWALCCVRALCVVMRCAL